MRILLNLGCGGVTPAGWINTDKSWNRVRVGLQRLWTRSRDKGGVRHLELGRRWPFKSDSVDVVYLSHVLEHLDEQARVHVIREAFRVLKPAGVFRVVVPDLRGLSEEYLERSNQGDSQAGRRFLYWLNLHKENLYGRNRSLFKKLYDAVQGYPAQHQFMFDRALLESEMSSFDWAVMEFLSYGLSPRVPEIKDVENGKAICASLYLEAVKR